MTRASHISLAVRLAICLVALAAVGLPGQTTAAIAHRAALAGVTLLAPVDKAAKPAGSFDSGVSLSIEIFSLAGDVAVGSPVGPSFAVGGPAGRKIKVYGGAKPRYQANWKTRQADLPNGATVRVELRLASAPVGPACNGGVSLSGGCIGYFDVYLRRGRSAKPPAGLLAIRNGRTLPIKLHIATGALAPTTPTDTPPTPTPTPTPSAAPTPVPTPTIGATPTPTPTTTPTPTPTSTELSELPGTPDEEAAGAIPNVQFVFRPDDYAPDPDLGGLTVSFRTLYLAFTLETTVAQANQLLTDINAVVIGGRQGVSGRVEGLLYVRVPTESHAEMDTLLERLRSDPRVLVAVPDALLEADEIPDQFGPDTPGDWFWQIEPKGGNWGLERMAVPQMWNFNRTIEKQFVQTNVGVLDKGFWDHPELDYELRIGSGGTDKQRSHGTHVAGIIAATYDNHTGIDGVSPFVRLYEMVDTPTVGGWGLLQFIETVPDLDVVNVSMGYGWYDPDQPGGAVDPALSAKAQNQVKYNALVFRIWQNILKADGRRLPLIVTAAGNDSGSSSLGNVNVDAKWNSGLTYAALVDDVDNVLVVGALEPVGDPVYDVKRAWFSNINAQTWAPGFGILSLGPASDPYRFDSGTSMASPAVAGVAAYLHSLDPTLTPAELKFILGAPVSYNHQVDAFKAALWIDQVRQNSAILTRLVDIDDGTLDGNQRLACDATSCTDITTEDFDADGGQGDGVIDMSDFRRWRDWFLQANDYPDLALDGDNDHPKKDLNHDGPVFPGTYENVFPDGDFNGDGKLDLNATNYMPGYVRDQVGTPEEANLTDLQVLQMLFNDPDYRASDLPDLIESADIHVNPSACMGVPGAYETETEIYEAATGASVDGRTTSDSPWSHIYTLPVVAGGYRVHVQVINSNGDKVGFAQRTFPAQLGSDSWFAPTCGAITLTPQRLNFVLNTGESETAHVTLASDGAKADWQFVNSLANVEPATTGGSLAPGGEVAIDPTITCPATPGGYGGFLRLEFRDEDGGLIDRGVPEYLSVDIVCLDGGVTVEPPSIELSMLVGESKSSTFILFNKGALLYYDTEPSDPIIHIDENAAGVLPVRGRVDIPFTVTCPDEPGVRSRHVKLTFLREDQKPVTVEVPEQVDIKVTCHDLIELEYQSYMSVAENTRNLGSGIKHQVDYVFDNARGDSYRRNIDWELDNYNVLTDTETFAPHPMMEFGSIVTSAASNATYHWGPPIDHDRSTRVSTSSDFQSTFDGSTASFRAFFTHDWGQDFDVSGAFDGVNWSQPGDGAADWTYFIFRLGKAAQIDIAWSCDGQFRGEFYWQNAWIRLVNITDSEPVPVFYTVGDGKQNCSYQGTLLPGRYEFMALSAFGSGGPGDVEWHQMTAHKTATYGMTLSFEEDQT